MLPVITINCKATIAGHFKVAEVIRSSGALFLCRPPPPRSLQTSSLLMLPLSSFVLSLALHRSVVPGYLPQLQPDADAGSAGYGSESPGSVKCHFAQHSVLPSLFAAAIHSKVSSDIVEEEWCGCVSGSLVLILESSPNYFS